jgi:uncharacterized membrane protein YqjE
MITQARQFMIACGRYVSARARLARLEGKEAGAHTLKILLLIAGLILLAGFMWLFLCLGLVSLLAGAFLQHGWLWSSLIMAGAHLLLILVLAGALKRKADTALFPLTAEELKKDQAWLEQHTPTKPRS